MRDIANRTLFAIAIPLATCLLLALLLGLQWKQDLRYAQQVEELIDVAVSISAVISHLEDERSRSAAMLSGLPALSPTLPAQRELTDAEVQTLSRLLQQLANGPNTPVLTAVREIAEANLADLPTLRDRTDRGEIMPLAEVASYTQIINQLLAAVDLVALDLRVPELVSSMSSFQRLQTFIGYSALERGLGTVLLGNEGIDPVYYEMLLKNLDAHQLMLAQLREAPAQHADRKIFEIIAGNTYAIEIEAFRARFAEPAALAEPDRQAAQQWFRLSSAYIVDIESALALWRAELYGKASQLKQRALVNVATLGAALMVLLGGVGWVSLSIRRRLIGKITNERRDAESIRFLGRHDPLTRLPNRYYFQDLVETEKHKTNSGNTLFSLQVIDIVHLNDINRVWGIDTGDAIIRETAWYLQQQLPADGQLARLDADRFGVLQPGIADTRAAGVLAQRLVTAFNKPVNVGGRQISLNIRVGITLFPSDAISYNALLRNADLARQQVRKGSGYAFYAPAIYQHYLAARALTEDLRKAVTAGEFQLLYQPKVDLHSRRLCGLEALIRWQHPQKGLLGPEQFIPEAERSGLIIEIGQWVFSEVCHQLQTWHGQGLQLPTLAINLSPVQFKQADLVAHFAAIIRHFGVDPARLELEVTETALIGNMDATLSTLQQLRDLGVSLSIDDFGTGYSSLSYLQQLPVQCLKLDRSFVATLESDPHTGQIVEAVITLSHGLGLSVVAEGVENQAQLDILAQKRCDQVQGYWLSKPLSVSELSGWLKAS